MGVRILTPRLYATSTHLCYINSSMRLYTPPFMKKWRKTVTKKRGKRENREMRPRSSNLRPRSSTHKDARKPLCAHECQQETAKETGKETANETLKETAKETTEAKTQRDRHRGKDPKRPRARNKESRIESVTAREQASGRQSAEGG